MARPTKYNPDIHLNWARGLAMQGFTGKEIASQMGIARSTFNKWKAEIREFSDAVEMGREPADFNVEFSLYKLANGFTQTEKKVIVTVNEKGEQKPARIEKTEKYFPPNPAAAMNWLKNRKPKDWREKQHVEIETHPFLNFVDEDESED
jgi:transcriptional regulator with XRE-family HTH domain